MIPLYFPINSTSLGASAYHIVRHLPEVSLFPIGANDISSYEPVPEEVKLKLSHAIANGLERHSIKGLSIKLWHPFAAYERITERQILYTFHELDSLTKIELNCLNQQEAIIVPSNFNKQVFESNGVRPPVYVIPLGVDRSVFYPLEKYKNKSGPYTFLMAGKFEARKCHLEILQAFGLTFANNPSVKLRCAIDNRFISMQNVHDMVRDRIFAGNIPSNLEFVNWMPTESHFADFLAHADCLISPSRGESFNLPLLQALSCGITVITNADHAHADYISDKNALLVKSSGKSVAYDGSFFRNDGQTNTGKWFDVGANIIATAMIDAFRRGRSVNTEGIETAKRFTWNSTAQKINELWDALKQT